MPQGAEIRDSLGVKTSHQSPAGAIEIPQLHKAQRGQATGSRAHSQLSEARAHGQSLTGEGTRQDSGKRNNCPQLPRENGEDTEDKKGDVNRCRRTDRQHQTLPPRAMDRHLNIGWVQGTSSHSPKVATSS